MKKLILLTVADSWHHFDVPIQEYSKRLQNNLEIIQLKPNKTGEIETLIKRDTEAVIKELEKYENVYRIYCDVDGKSLGNTLEFSTWLSKKSTNYKSVIFIIGWSYWLDTWLLASHIDFKLSFSPWTLPHWLAVLTLLEQLYRALNIANGGKYHHE